MHCLHRPSAKLGHRAVRLVLAVLAVLVLGAAFSTSAAGEDGSPARNEATAPERLNGFELGDARVPFDQIYRGGPPRDGVPALDTPAFVAAAGAPWRETDFVIGVAIGAETRAYPIAILEWHELVNDVVGGIPILVSWCPLCGTALVFDRRAGGRALEFGVSGLLYKSDLLMFDRATESLWSQISARAIAGPQAGARLRLLPSRMTTWRHWKELHPGTLVLWEQTGYPRPYLSASGPYRDYATSPELRFPADYAARYHPKEPTLGVRIAGGVGAARAYPRVELRAAGDCVLETFAGQTLRIEWIERERSFAAQVVNEAGAPERAGAAARDTSATGAEFVEFVEGYWFAWSAFHPQSSVFAAGAGRPCASAAPHPDGSP